MFSRSAKLQKELEEKWDKEKFMEKVFHWIYEADYFITPNDFPYDLCEGEPCETEHYILRFHKSTAWIAFLKALEYRNQGYTIIMRPLHLCSVKEIPHIHLVRKKI